MGTAALSPKSVELFYSYAHCDETLCKELQKHLTALKRAGLIRDWYDRKIDPGSEWAIEIQNAMERAGLILLLISADFLASKYIFDVELPFALKRHSSGFAKVVPVLLRPVEWRDLPFAKLQVLPSDGRPVTAWPDPDQAFSDVAARLRELIYGQRLNELAASSRPVTDTIASQQRVLDAAIASNVVVDEPTDLVTMFHTGASVGLRAILSLDRSYSATSDDVKSNEVEVDFPLDSAGNLLPGTLRITVASPDFDPPSQEKQVRVPTVGDSDVFVFMLTPKRSGTLRVVLQVFKGDLVIASRLLATKSTTAAAAEPTARYGVVSISVATRVPRTRPIPRSLPKIRENREGAPILRPPMPTRSAPSPGAVVYASAGKTSTGKKWLVGVGSSVAAIAFVSSALYFQTAKYQARASRTLAPATAGAPPASPAEPIPQEQDGPVTRNQVTSPLRQLQERADAANEQLRTLNAQMVKEGREIDPQLILIQKRINTNLRNADYAQRAQKPKRAVIYMRDVEKDLSTLEHRLK